MSSSSSTACGKNNGCSSGGCVKKASRLPVLDSLNSFPPLCGSATVGKKPVSSAWDTVSANGGGGDDDDDVEREISRHASKNKSLKEVGTQHLF